MNYVVRRPLEAFGYDLTIGTPFGNQTLHIPIEGMATAMADIAMARMNEAIPGMIDGATARIKPFIDAEYKRWGGMLDRVSAMESRAEGMITKTEATLTRGGKAALITVGIVAALGVGVAAFSAISRKKHAKAVA